LVLALQSRISQGFGLSQTLCVGHLLGVRELAPNLGAPSHLNARSPAAKAPSGNAVTEDQIPTRFIAMTGRTFATRFESVNLAVQMHLIRRLKTRCANSVNELNVRRSDLSLWRG
jgi:hypothetical protein